MKSIKPFVYGDNDGKIKNELIRGMAHVILGGTGNVVIEGLLRIELSGKRPRGRPKTIWREDMVREDMEIHGVRQENEEDRGRCRKICCGDT